jgi:hypothetical protein
LDRQIGYAERAVVFWYVTSTAAIERARVSSIAPHGGYSVGITQILHRVA